MRKVTAIILAVTMVFGLAACEKSSDSTKQSSAKIDVSKEETVSDNGNDTSSSETGNAGSNVLVVYYSATGNTKSVAEKIAAQTNGELFELKPVDEYTEDDLNYNDSESRVCKEYDDESLRDVELTEVTPEGFDSAEVVFIGYPIWWGIAAWPVDRFVKDNDFTGKTVIPFCTSASSGLGDSGNLLEEMAGTGDWLEGQRFSSNASDKEVQDWVESLHLK